jgi:hypothetical protein
MEKTKMKTKTTKLSINKQTLKNLKTGVRAGAEMNCTSAEDTYTYPPTWTCPKVLK